MDNGNVQLIAAALVVAGATGFLLRRLYRFVRGTSTGGCQTDGCSTCPQSESPTGNQQKPLVQLKASDAIDNKAEE